MKDGLYYSEYGIYRVSDKSNGKQYVEVYKNNKFIPAKNTTMDIFIKGMSITEKTLKSIISLANGNDSGIKKSGSLYQVSSSLGITIDEARRKIS